MERRNQRKFGVRDGYWKLLDLKLHIKICNACGHHHEIGVLCSHCYRNTKEETQLIQEKIQNKLGLLPVVKEVIVLYDGEKGIRPNENLQGKQMIEMTKPRPRWFCRNLLQKSTQSLTISKDVKPDELG